MFVSLPNSLEQVFLLKIVCWLKIESNSYEAFYVIFSNKFLFKTKLS